MRFASLGSGSSGNGLLVEAGETTVLLDCGFGLADARNRLARLGKAAEYLTAIVVTHEHSDHMGGVARLARKFRLPVYLTYGTYSMAASQFEDCDVHWIMPDSAFAVDDVEIMPYAVPHDAREPVQFVFSDGLHRLGVLTDAGSITAHICEHLNGCDALVLECNHDREMLWAGRYPASLKRRVAGAHGHLDNETAASLLSRIDCTRLQHLVAAHISAENNTPDLAVQALVQQLNCSPDWVAVADQEAGLDWRELRTA